MFWTNTSPPHLGSLSKPRKRSEEAGSNLSLAYSSTLKLEAMYVPPKCQALSKLHSVTIQKTVVFIVPATTSNPRNL
jgi:hypothetical protein